MMKLQSIFRLLSIVFIFLAVISCKKNDESPANFISYSGETYSVKEGIYGDDFINTSIKLNPEDPDEITHDIRIFYLSDGEFVYDQVNDPDSLLVDASYLLIFDLLTPVGVEDEIDAEYRYENFLYIIGHNYFEVDYSGEYLFGLSALVIDTNENGLIDDFDDRVYINDGTISFLQQENYFEIELKVATVGEDFIENKSKIEMKYSGTLKWFESE